jgi:hypothetical protein
MKATKKIVLDEDLSKVGTVEETFPNARSFIRPGFDEYSKNRNLTMG